MRQGDWRLVRNHEHLCDWTDLQVTRAWRDGFSPQDFDLFTTAAYRSPALDGSD